MLGLGWSQQQQGTFHVNLKEPLWTGFYFNAKTADLEEIDKWRSGQVNGIRDGDLADCQKEETERGFCEHWTQLVWQRKGYVQMVKRRLDQ